jgi:hypothetical protein
MTELHQGLQTAGSASLHRERPVQTTNTLLFTVRPMLAANLRPLFHTVEHSRVGHQEELKRAYRSLEILGLGLEGSRADAVTSGGLGIAHCLVG